MADNDNKDIVRSPNASEVAQHFAGERLNQMFKLAKQFHEAGCFGADVKNPQQALVKMQAGYEMGLPPMEAMGALYIVNGKVTIYGHAMVKRLRQKGWTVQYEDKAGECTATINKGDETYAYVATMDELKKLNSKAAQFAPKEKLRYHALSRLIRFNVPEVLDAGVTYLKEELEDMPSTGAPTVKVVDGFDADHALKVIHACKDAKELKAVGETIGAKDLSEGVAETLQNAFLEKMKEFEADEPKKEEVDPDKPLEGQTNTVDAIDEATGEVKEESETAKELDGHAAHALLKVIRSSQFVSPRTEAELNGMMAELDELRKKGIITGDEYIECHGKVKSKLSVLLQSKK